MRNPSALIVAGLVSLSLAEGLSHFAQSYVDSQGYVEVALFFLGRSTGLMGGLRFRLIRPVVPFLASLLSLVVKPRIAFGVVNLVFWCASTVLMFYFARLLTKSTSAALISSVFLTSAIPLLILGDAVYTDMAGYFFILLGAYIVLKWDLPRANLERVVLAALVVQVGMLTRESVACVLLFALVWCFLSRGSLPRIILFVAIVVGLSVLWAALFGINYLDWYMAGGVSLASLSHLGVLGTVSLLIRSVLYAFGEYPEVLILAFLGFLRIHDLHEFKIYASFIVAAGAIIIAWPVVGTRFSFILFPAIFPLASVGIEEAYAIILKSPLVSTIWPSLKPSRRSLLMFQFVIILVYAVITNIVTVGYVSFPWNPLIDPSLPPSYIQWLQNY